MNTVYDQNLKHTKFPDLLRGNILCHEWQAQF